MKPVLDAFVAASVRENATDCCPPVMVAAVVHVGGVAIFRVKVSATTASVALPCALTVNEYDPAAEGVPDSRPAALNVTPVGRVPEASEYDTVLLAPSCREYAAPLGASARADAVDQTGSETTDCVNVWVVPTSAEVVESALTPNV